MFWSTRTRGTLRPEEQTFVQLLHKQAALHRKIKGKPAKNGKIS